VVAFGFDAYSDLRIKDTIGKSNPANDLQTLRSIRITDYRMKDRATFGNKPFKKVIAQQVEKVYPQLISKHAEFIPNVYQLTDKVTKTAGGYLLHFPRPHHLGDTARRLKAILSERSGMEAFNIVSVPSPDEVIIDAPTITTEKIFVYGEEVADFRTVDYEGLTTLNVSATQEIDKKVEGLDKKVEGLTKNIEQLQKALAAANGNIRTLTQLVLQSKNGFRRDSMKKK
jgi:hypothetical protein